MVQVSEMYEATEKIKLSSVNESQFSALSVLLRLVMFNLFINLILVSYLNLSYRLVLQPIF